MTAREKVYNYVKKMDYPVSPKQISDDLELNYNTVRGVCSKFVKDGRFIRPYSRHYTIAETHGVNTTKIPLRIQNLDAIVHPIPRITRPFLEEGQKQGLLVLNGRTFEHVYEYPCPSGKNEVTRHRIRFGVTNNKITWTIKAPLGLDYDALMSAYGYVKRIIHEMGFTILETDDINSNYPRCFVVIKFELLRDIMDTRLELEKCITFSSFSGVIEKIYNKTYGVRHEFRYNRPTSMTEITALMYGGLPNLISAQSIFQINQSIDKFTKAQKYIPNKLNELVERINVFGEIQYKLLDKVDSIERKLE